MLEQNKSILWWLLWYGLGAVLLAGVADLTYETPIWALPKQDAAHLAILLAAFGTSALLAWFSKLSGEQPSVTRLTLLTTAVFSAALLVLTLGDIHPRRVLLLSVVVLGLILVPSVYLLPRWRLYAVTLVVAIAALCFAVATYGQRRVAAAKSLAHVEHSFVATSLYNVGLTTYQSYIRKPFARGGGLAQVGSRLLLATGDGALYSIRIDSMKDQIEAKQLPYSVPLNATAFAKSVGGTYEEPTYWEVAKKSDSVQAWRFRVAGIYARQDGSRLTLFASHHYWKSDEHCYVVRLSMLETDVEAFFSGTIVPQWQTVFESTPCMRLDLKQEVASNTFFGEEIGGRIAMLDANTVLLTVGGMGYDGVDFELQVSHDPAYSYGKTIAIDLRSRANHVFTSGHRNPQGLYVDAAQNIWSTEHGPQGGDELNLLREGRDYGWPTVTYGTDYGTMTWPNNPHQGDHEGYELPIFAWVPSIGISALTQVTRDTFPNWHGDLIIGSLATQSLFRTRIREGRVVLVEPIYVGHRIRDVIETSSGELLLWTDDAALISVSPANDRDAPALFAAQCGGCHTAIHGARHGIGPNLWGIYGAKVATNESYDEYSSAMHAVSGTWDEARLDRFLSSPSIEIPGTRMRFAGLPNPDDRYLIVQYLKTLSD